MPPTDHSNRPRTLRERAEQIARASRADIAAMSTEEVQKLVQELQTHQIELELQAEDLRQAQVELALSRDRFVDLYDFAPVGYISQDQDGKILEANLAAAALLGVLRKDLLGANINKFLIPESQDVAYLHRQSVLAGAASVDQLSLESGDTSDGVPLGVKQACELSMRKADGTPLVVRLESIAIGIEQDRHCRTALIDMTAVNRARQLQESERRYRRLTEAVTDYVYHVRVEHGQAVETSHSAGCVAVTGYTAEEFAANPLLWITMVPPEDRAIVRKQTADILTDQYSAPVEHRIQRKDGAIRWVLDTVSPQHDEQGNLIAFDGLIRDITQRKVAEESLRELNETLEYRVTQRTSQLQEANDELRRTHFTVERSQDAIIWIEQVGGLLFANEAACRLTGYEHDELMSKSFADLDADLTVQQWPKFWQRFRDEEAMLIERSVRTKDGRIVPVELSPTHLQFDHQDFVCVYARNISQRKHIEQQLRIKDKAIASAASGIAITDCDGIISYANSAFARMWGYDSIDEIVGRSNADFSSSQQDVAEVMLGLREHGSWVGERVGKRKDGTTFDVWIAASTVQDDDGQNRCLMSSFIDISERKQAQRLLQESEVFTQSILASLTAHIAVIDDTGTILAVNSAWDQFAQSNAGIIQRCGVGANYFDVCRRSSGPYADQAPAVLAGLQAILENKTTRFSIEYPCHSPEQKRWFVLHATSLAGQRPGLVISHNDITRRRQSEESLRREHEFAENLIRMAQNIVLVLDPQGRIVQFNPYFENLSGWPLSDVSGKDWFDTFIPERDRARIRDRFDKALRGGGSTSDHSNTILTRDGRQRETEWYSAQLTDEHHRVIGLLCTGRDITERKALERHVLHIATEEQRRIGQDLHDGVGQQLTGLAMMADTLLTSLKRKNLSESVFAEKLANGLKRAVGDLRQLARGLNPVEIDPQGLRSALEELAQQAEDLYGISCTCHCDDLPPLRDSESSTQLFRIAQEALNNAAKHAKATRLSVSMRCTDGLIELKVVDNGVGMQRDMTGGLGLRSMGYRAGVIGGKLRIESGEDGGTIVACSLPNAVPEGSANSTPTPISTEFPT